MESDDETLQNGSCGILHGQMNRLVRNPFNVRHMRQEFERVVRLYDLKDPKLYKADGTRSIFYHGGRSFWRGFDGIEDPDMNVFYKQSSVYAWWRAGREIHSVIASAAHENSCDENRSIE